MSADGRLIAFSSNDSNLDPADADGVAAVLTYSARHRLLLRHLHRFRALRLRTLDLLLASESPLHRRTRGQHLASCRT